MSLTLDRAEYSPFGLPDTSSPRVANGSALRYAFERERYAMYINHDVVKGKLKQAAGKLRRTRGQLTRNRRDQLLGSLQYQVGRLQERGGIVLARIQHAAKRLQDRRA